MNTPDYPDISYVKFHARNGVSGRHYHVVYKLEEDADAFYVFLPLAQIDSIQKKELKAVTIYYGNGLVAEISLNKSEEK